MNVDSGLFFSTDLLVDYQVNPPAPTLAAHINGFLKALAHQGGPIEAAFNYLHGGTFFPVGKSVV